jgi:AcrR family transcriptional regulator
MLAEPSDDIREALLDAAASVFAEKGYDGTRIQDVVRRAGLSTGAVYGRFTSKDEMLREAVITRCVPHARRLPDGITRVADLIERIATRTSPELREYEALLLEAYVSARRHPEIAEAINEANRRWREAAGPFVEEARADVSLAEGVDGQSVLFLIRVLRLGLLLHRASGLPEPDAETWSALVARVVASIGDARRPEGAIT